jgi:hypothetical protein
VSNPTAKSSNILFSSIFKKCSSSIRCRMTDLLVMGMYFSLKKYTFCILDHEYMYFKTVSLIRNWPYTK